MLYPDHASKLVQQIRDYRNAVAQESDAKAKAVFGMIANTADEVLQALEKEDANQLEINMYSFSWQVTDSLYDMPLAYQPVSDTIGQIKRLMKIERLESEKKKSFYNLLRKFRKCR
jgi:hypothetical protein